MKKYGISWIYITSRKCTNNCRIIFSTSKCNRIKNWWSIICWNSSRNNSFSYIIFYRKIMCSITKRWRKINISRISNILRKCACSSGNLKSIENGTCCYPYQMCLWSVRNTSSSCRNKINRGKCQKIWTIIPKSNTCTIWIDGNWPTIHRSIIEVNILCCWGTNRCIHRKRCRSCIGQYKNLIWVIIFHDCCLSTETHLIDFDCYILIRCLEWELSIWCCCSSIEIELKCSTWSRRICLCNPIRIESRHITCFMEKCTDVYISCTSRTKISGYLVHSSSIDW